jgi:hypothetical protein
MRNLILGISLVVNAIMLGYIVYTGSNRVSLSEATIQSLTENVPSATLDEVINAFGVFINGIADENTENTQKIPVELANTMHRYYLANRANPRVDSSRAIQFSMPVLIRAIYDGSKNASGQIDNTVFLDNLLKSSFYVYLAKYDQQTNPSNIDNTTALIQLANMGTGRVLTDQIFNFGQVCPTVCPDNEQITVRD